mmetsp:Transcript_118429/g.334826  ORF Transcript_118429/g.334826 Transcript_118429/m.334826 type:complete len:264 (-) Transcript_118429:715-1506(-)
MLGPIGLSTCTHKRGVLEHFASLLPFLGPAAPPVRGPAEMAVGALDTVAAALAVREITWPASPRAMAPRAHGRQLREPDSRLRKRLRELQHPHARRRRRRHRRRRRNRLWCEGWGALGRRSRRRWRNRLWCESGGALGRRKCRRRRRKHLECEKREPLGACCRRNCRGMDHCNWSRRRRRRDHLLCESRSPLSGRSRHRGRWRKPLGLEERSPLGWRRQRCWQGGVQCERRSRFGGRARPSRRRRENPLHRVRSAFGQRRRCN